MPVVGTVLNLALFPQAFLYQRMFHSDVIFVLTDRELDESNHINRCAIRTSTEYIGSLNIPVREKPVVSDHARVYQIESWRGQFLRDIRRGYRNLKYQGDVESMVSAALPRKDSPWLIDVLLPLMLATFDKLGWRKKIVRGSSLERRRYPDDSTFLLDLCLEAECDRLLLGKSRKINLHQRLFRRNDIEFVLQSWDGTPRMPKQDSILDQLVRFTPEEITEQFR